LEDKRFIKVSRAFLGLTQSDLAYALGLTGNSIARMERGELDIRRVVILSIQFLLYEAGYTPRDLKPSDDI
tara:strand:- start:76 stop:288 length:213 start_codon:yes stop_codon:yes gene_type:complete